MSAAEHLSLLPLRVGVTGSRHGLTDAQKQWAVNQMADTPISEFHYGDCVGADEELFWVWFELGAGGVAHAWPGNVAHRWRAFTTDHSEMVGIDVHNTMPPLDRNRQIVAHSDTVWAFPNTMTEQPKGGTWYTIRHTRTTPNTELIVVLPDGTTSN